MNPLSAQVRKAVLYDLTVISFTIDAICGDSTLKIEDKAFHTSLKEFQKFYHSQMKNHIHLEKKSITYLELKVQVHKSLDGFLDMVKFIHKEFPSPSLELTIKGFETSLDHLMSQEATHWWPTKRYEAQYQLLFTTFLSCKQLLVSLANVFEGTLREDILQNEQRFVFLGQYKHL